MSGDGEAEGALVLLMVARAGAGPPLVTPGPKGKESPLPPHCVISCWGWCLVSDLGSRSLFIP